MCLGLLYFFANRRWRNPEDPEDLEKLKKAWQELSDSSVVVAGQCKFDRMCKVIARFHHDSQKMQVLVKACKMAAGALTLDSTESQGNPARKRRLDDSISLTDASHGEGGHMQTSAQGGRMQTSAHWRSPPSYDNLCTSFGAPAPKSTNLTQSLKEVHVSVLPIPQGPAHPHFQTASHNHVVAMSTAGQPYWPGLWSMLDTMLVNGPMMQPQMQQQLLLQAMSSQAMVSRLLPTIPSISSSDLPDLPLGPRSVSGANNINDFTIIGTSGTPQLKPTPTQSSPLKERQAGPGGMAGAGEKTSSLIQPQLSGSEDPLVNLFVNSSAL